MKKKLSLLFACLLYLGCWAQTNYYVSTSGNNSNSGTSIAQAWETIQYAMNNATANSIVNITAGTYNEKVEVNVSGSAGNPIIFKNYNTDLVIVDGTGVTTWDAIIGIFDQNYITIQGLKIRNNEQLDAQGIIVEGDCQGIEIRDNEISNIHFSSNPGDVANSSTNSQPMIVYGSNGSSAISDLIIDGNTVHSSRTGYSEGLAVNGNVDGFVVSNNTVYGISNIGIDIIGHENTAPSNDQARNGVINNNTVYNCKSPYATAAGIYVDGGKDLVIEANRVYDCQWGIEVGCENIGKTTDNVRVRNNMIYDNDDSGISVGGYNYPSNSGKVENCIISNNTAYGNDKNIGGLGGVSGELNITYTENCVFENNIFYATTPSNLMLFVDNVGSQNLSLNYNLFYSAANMNYDYDGNYYSNFGAYQSGSSQDANSLESDPLFSNPLLFNLHLGNDSPAINAGDPAFTPAVGELDFDGQNRIINGQVDIGADESEMVLPVTYLSPFSGRLEEGVVLLRWHTASEQDANYFQVERSLDGRIWEKLGARIKSKNQQSFYQTIDKKPIDPLVYYRLQQVDFDGHSAYSNTINLTIPDEVGTLLLYPNPVHDILHFQTHRKIEKVILINGLGQVLLRKEIRQNEGVDLSQVPKGFYTIQLTSRHLTSSHPIVVD